MDNGRFREIPVPQSNVVVEHCCSDCGEVTRVRLSKDCVQDLARRVSSIRLWHEHFHKH